MGSSQWILIAAAALAAVGAGLCLMDPYSPPAPPRGAQDAMLSAPRERTAALLGAKGDQAAPTPSPRRGPIATTARTARRPVPTTRQREDGAKLAGLERWRAQCEELQDPILERLLHGTASAGEVERFNRASAALLNELVAREGVAAADALLQRAPLHTVDPRLGFVYRVDARGQRRGLAEPE